MAALATAGPSLALTKYWGKATGGVNLPATPSLAVTLSQLRSVTKVSLRRAADGDEVSVNGKIESPERFRLLLDELRNRTGYDGAFEAWSVNNFPTAAGLASSASGMAALATACDAALESTLSPQELSALARLGSGSAARSIFGGFVLFGAAAPAAEPLFPQDHWESLRIVAVALHAGEKPISSRNAMNLTAETSPFFASWVEDAHELTDRAVEAAGRRDLQSLGVVARESYMRMFATMLGSSPPVLYWRPESVSLLHLLQELREQGIPVWETMDAGPQVKVLVEEEHLEEFLTRLPKRLPDATATVTSVGGRARVVEAAELTENERRLLGVSG